MGIPFVKFHGFGNDYIVIDRSSISESVPLAELAEAVCHRHTGAGADGIAVIEPVNAPYADFFCEIINPDGSTAGFSGNGTRCAVAYLYHECVWSVPGVRLSTRSGVKNFQRVEPHNGSEYWFEAEIGRPEFASCEVPIDVPEPLDAVTDLPISVDGSEVRIACVRVGNPVACVFVEDFPPSWRTLGRLMENHVAFPDRANIVFVKVQHFEHIEIRIWERGAGETSASGTCSAGAAILSAFTGRTGRIVNVHSPGGVTRVAWRDDEEIVLTGKATFVYRGEWPG